VALQLHTYNTILTLHEHSLNTVRSRNALADPLPNLRRVESLSACLVAVKSWFQTFFSLETVPLSCYPCISMALFTGMAHCLVALFRLSTFEAPGIPWDRQQVKEELDFREVLKLWSDRWEKVPAAAGLEVLMTDGAEDNMWFYTREKLSALTHWFDSKTAAMAAEAERQHGQGLESGILNGPTNPARHPTDIDFGMLTFDPFDDAWMRDMISGGFDFNTDTF
jgi:hypothetical protein